MAICSLISRDVLRVCDSKPVAGIKQRLMLINTDDLPITGITKDATNPNELMTSIALSTGKTGYEVSGIKQIMNYTNAFETGADTENGIRHSIAGIRIFDPSEEARGQINNFIGGANVFAVLERNWKGEDNKYAYLFFGLTFGLELSELSDGSNENDGTTVLTLATPANFKEPNLPHIYRDADYATSTTAFNNKFKA